ncbi:hypothetical protein F4809DRAFT_585630 [Biscogniauxia mediterranea]|nr:hypothetical protein F4809DRAFT_585630 [Biscogniauxia mediterranea]
MAGGDLNTAEISRLIQKGIAYYSQDNYARAIVFFTKAAHGCTTCRCKVRTQPCPCLSVLDGIEKNTLRRELKRNCSCPSKVFQRCKSSRHMEALDYLAASHEKEGRLVQAQWDAEDMIHLSPRDPRGYLRLGKVLRLQKLYRLAYLTYIRGVELVQEFNSTNPLFPVLQEMGDKTRGLLKTDPICKFPVEIVVMIFKNVDFRSFCRSRCVSTTWRDYLTNTKRQTPVPAIYDFWSAPIFAYSRATPKASVSQLVLRSYLIYSNNQLTQLAIGNTSKFGLDERKLHYILRSCPNMKSLVLRGSTFFFLGPVPNNIPLPKLTKLYLGPEVVCAPNFLQQILAASAGTLEELSVFEVGESDPVVDWRIATQLPPWPMLDKLKVLRISTQRGKKAIDLVRIMNSTPNLEEAWISLVVISSPENDQFHPWKKLRSFSLRCDDQVFFHASHPPFFHPDIQEIYIDGEHAHKFCLERALAPGMALSSLRRFKYVSRDSLPNDVLDRWIRPGIASGSLKELELKPFSLDVLPNVQPNNPMSWFTSEHLTFLGLKGLWATVPAASIDMMLLSNCFPNLRALEVGRTIVDDVTLANIMRRGVNRLYHRNGLLKETLREWAEKELGAKVIDGTYAPTHLEIWTHWYADATQNFGGSRLPAS